MYKAVPVAGNTWWVGVNDYETDLLMVLGADRPIAKSLNVCIILF